MGKILFETKPFSQQASKYAHAVMMMLLARFLWVPILLIGCCIVLGMVVNSAFFYVSLILLFILFPSVLVFAYFYMTTTMEARIAVLSKSIKIEETGILVKFEPIRYSLPNGDVDEEKEVLPTPIFIHNEDVRNVENMGNSIRIFLKKGKYNFITIPINEVVGDKDDFWAHVLRYND